MHFFVQVLFKKDGTVDKGTTVHNTSNEAEQQFCLARSSAISKPEYQKGIFFVFDEEGTIKFKRIWKRD